MVNTWGLFQSPLDDADTTELPYLPQGLRSLVDPST